MSRRLSRLTRCLPRRRGPHGEAVAGNRVILLLPIDLFQPLETAVPQDFADFHQKA